MLSCGLLSSLSVCRLLCPGGWCYATRCRFYGDNRALIWHDGWSEKNKKLVIANSTFDAKSTTILGRYQHDSQFYIIHSRMSEMILSTNISSAYSDKILDPCPRGQRTYYYGCVRQGDQNGRLEIICRRPKMHQHSMVLQLYFRMKLPNSRSNAASLRSLFYSLRKYVV